MTRPPLRLILAGGRDVTSRLTVVRALSDGCLLVRAPGPDNPQYARPIQLVHGDCATGTDAIGDDVWADWVATWPTLYLPAEKHPAKWAECGEGCPDRPHRKRRRTGEEYCPIAGNRRNGVMVAAGADQAVTVATANSRGTPDLARQARAAQIPVLDAGLPTTGRRYTPTRTRRAA